MKKIFVIILSALILTIIRASAQDSAMSISLSIPAHWEGKRAIENHDQYAPHFHVIVTNVSGKQQRIWQEWCSWGYYGLSFEFMDDKGKKWVAEKGVSAWTKNYPSYWTLDPQESLVLDVYYTDTNTWKDFPMPEDESQTVTMKAIFEFKPDDFSKQDGTWIGRVESKPEKITFYHWKPDVK